MIKHPPDIPRTAMEVFNMLPEGTRCEVIDNSLYMSPSPTTRHQKILGSIYFQLRAAGNRLNGEVFVAPLDVYLNAGDDIVQPDIIVVKNENSAIIGDNGIHGSPDLVIEILSSDTRHDTVNKFELYQANRIAEYVIVDPETRKVFQYILVNGVYESKPTEIGKIDLWGIGVLF